MESSVCKASESGWMRLAGVTLLGAVLGPVAHAEDSRERQQNAVLEEVVVTAERRSENLQDVPISMTALTNEDLRDLHIQSTTDLAAQVPNFDVRPTGSGENTYVGITIRGVSSVGLTYAAGQPVLVYSDDQLLESILSHGMAFFDMESIEVLRGPQGTLFGRNTTAGAMSVRSARPGHELNGYAELETTSATRLAMVSTDTSGTSSRRWRRIDLATDRLVLQGRVLLHQRERDTVWRFPDG